LSISVTISEIEHEAAVLFLSHQPSQTTIMSHTHSSSSSSNFQSVFNVALDAYESKTESSLLTHPLAAELQSCDSPTAILSILQDLTQQFDRRHRGDQRLTSWLNPTINVLYAFSGTIGQGVGLVSLNSYLRRICDPIVIPQAFSPANAVFSGIGVLLLVSIILDRRVLAIVTTVYLRRLKM
jgi:hypothetical protein